MTDFRAIAQPVPRSQSVWEALAGSAPGRPDAPDDPDLWRLVADRLNPARARPSLREGIVESRLTSARGLPYVVLRSPDSRPSYLRLTPEEADLARLMDGAHTVASLVGEFARATGTLAPAQVVRVVADLAANRMLTELPTNAFSSLDRLGARVARRRVGHVVLNIVRGRRFVVGSPDRVLDLAYRLGARLFFTRPVALLLALVGIIGFGAFVRTWASGGQAALHVSGSWGLGAISLLGFNVAALIAHEAGHGLAMRHARCKVPAAGFLLYFGIPSIFVDTTDAWMAGRRARIVTSAAGPAAVAGLAGALNLAALASPGLASVAFKLSFAWYLNTLLNLNPLMALDGYYLLMDWLEVPNLRTRGLQAVIAMVRRRVAWRKLDSEGRIVTLYGVLAAAWALVFMSLSVRAWKDRVSTLVAGLWHSGVAARALLAGFVLLLVAPLGHALIALAITRVSKARSAMRERDVVGDEPRRLAAIRASRLGLLAPEQVARIARESRWVQPKPGADVITAGASVPGAVVVVEGALHGRRPGDPAGTVRERAATGDVVAVGAAVSARPSALTWTAAGTRLLVVPGAVMAAASGGWSLAAEDQSEREAVLDLPLFEAMSDDERHEASAQMRPLDLTPGQTISGSNPGRAAVVADGVLLTSDGRELRRGDLFGPPLDGSTIEASARTAARLWSVEASAAKLVTPAATVVATAFGAHGGEEPPVVGPPPRSGSDGGDGQRRDRRIRRALGVVVALAVVLGVLALDAARRPGVGWADAPRHTALLVATLGKVDAAIGDRVVQLDEGGRVLIGAADRVVVRERSVGTIFYRGGGISVLCPSTRATIEALSGRRTSSGREVPAAALALRGGRAISATRTHAAAFHDLALRVRSAGHLIANTGVARFSVGDGEAIAGSGVVRRDGVLLPVTPGSLPCGAATAATLACSSAVLQEGITSEPTEDGDPTASYGVRADGDAGRVTTTTARATATTTSTGGATTTITVGLTGDPSPTTSTTIRRDQPGPSTTTTRPATTTTRPQTGTTRPATTTTRLQTTTTRPPTTTTRPQTTTTRPPTTTTRPQTTTTRGNTTTTRPPTTTTRPRTTTTRGNTTTTRNCPPGVTPCP